MSPPHPAADPLAEQVLEVFAKNAGVPRERLLPERRPDELGVGSLDLALTLFAIEDHFGIDLPELPADAPLPTLGELLQRVREAVAMRPSAAGPPVGAQGSRA